MHLSLRCDHLQAAFGLTHCNILPGVVSFELGPREPVRYLQRVPVLLGNGPASPHGERRRTDRYQPERTFRHGQLLR
jgi:hypothetical protein